MASATTLPASRPCTSAPRAARCQTTTRARAAHLPRAIRERNARIERYRNLVRPIALHYHHCSAEPLDDLLQVGLLGLLRAAELYAPATGTPFIAYARPHVRGAILHYLRDHSTAVRLPRRLQEWQLQLQRWQQQHPNAADACLHRDAAERCRRQLGLSREQWQRLMAAALLRRPLSLDAPQRTTGTTVTVEEDEPWAGSIGDTAAADSTPDDTPDVLALLSQLPGEQRLVVERVVLAGWSYRRLAAALQVSPMTIQRRLQRGLAQLRQLLQP